MAAKKKLPIKYANDCIYTTVDVAFPSQFEDEDNRASREVELEITRRTNVLDIHIGCQHTTVANYKQNGFNWLAKIIADHYRIIPNANITAKLLLAPAVKKKADGIAAQLAEARAFIRQLHEVVLKWIAFGEAFLALPDFD